MAWLSFASPPAYARQGSTSLSVETLLLCCQTERASSDHSASASSGPLQRAIYSMEILSADKVVAAATLTVENGQVADLPAPFQQPLPAGFYKVRATYRQQGRFREFYENGFWVADAVRWTRVRPWESMAISSLAVESHFFPLAPTTSPPKKMAGISPARAMLRCGRRILRRWPRTV